jgi:hypothetical protein
MLKGGGEVLAAGGTHVMPLDVTSRNRLALAEHHAYRERTGPPPARRAVFRENRWDLFSSDTLMSDRGCRPGKTEPG